jgi:DNA polymerase III delta prime subunit
MESVIILTGPPGCGKSHWIHKYAEQRKRQLYVCPCRRDRTLRDGRQKLHLWGRKTEPSILWLEGADDLTPEAQAFLRRILETHAPQVQFILECRDSSKLQEPIRSRCVIKRLNAPCWNDLERYMMTYREINRDQIKEYLTESEYSYRRVNNCIYLQIYNPDIWRHVYDIRIKEKQESVCATSDKLPSYIANAYNPEIMIEEKLKEENNIVLLTHYGECRERAGSIWAFLGAHLR